MTTAPVQSITDEQLDELEGFLAEAEPLGPMTDCATVRALITRLREAEKDAARYKFLRNSGKFSPSAFGDGWALNCGYTRAQPIELDRAVDDAMQEHKQ